MNTSPNKDTTHPDWSGENRSSCDWCGDWVQMDELAFYADEDICTSCVGDYEKCCGISDKDSQEEIPLLTDGKIERIDVGA